MSQINAFERLPTMKQQDENFDVIYTNGKINREEWRTFKVGETRFNDDATRRAGMLPTALASQAQSCEMKPDGSKLTA
jgi:hypothetical protein